MSAVRDAEATRLRILEVTADEMRRHGFKATSLSEIIAKSQVSKGALYHHFTNKLELGYAVFEELFVTENIKFWGEVLQQEDPLAGFCQHLENIPSLMSDDDIECGCPVNSISQEMSAEDEGFRELTLAMYLRMQGLFLSALETCDKHGLLKSDLNLKRCALFFVSSLQGISSLVKASRDRETITELTLALKDYVIGLRVDAVTL